MWLSLGIRKFARWTALAAAHAAASSAENMPDPPSPGRQVAVVYNAASPDSQAVANHYAARRGVPARHLIGLDLPLDETIDRTSFENRMASPLLARLKAAGALTFTQRRPEADAPDQTPVPVLNAAIRYLVVAYGCPLKIAADPKTVDAGADKLPPELRGNHAAVDSELALLPLRDYNTPISGLIPNRAYQTEDPSQLGPATGALMVTRLDGPTPEIAKGLVDKAIAAEETGLWGRAYFDSRNISTGSYAQGDQWIRNAAAQVKKEGWETELDLNPNTLVNGYPMSDVAFYAGWYYQHANGPFKTRSVEFAPGAIAYHLHSFSASSVRSVDHHWVGPLLSLGATATLGCVYEPYLSFTPNIEVLVNRLLRGFTFAEAAYAAMPALSWQVTVVGDPLYRPISRTAKKAHEYLEAIESPLAAWSHVKIVNVNIEKNQDLGSLETYLLGLPLTRESPILLEKLGDVFLAQNNKPKAVASLRFALQKDPSLQQRQRIHLRLAPLLQEAEEHALALDSYEAFLRAAPAYADAPKILEAMQKCAAALGDLERLARFKAEMGSASAE